MESAKYNLSQQVLDLTAYPIFHYPPVEEASSRRTGRQALGVSRCQCGSFSHRSPGMVFAPCGLSNNDSRDKSRVTNHPIIEQSNQSKIIDHRRRVIDQLMEHVKRHDEGMDNLEVKMDGTSSQDKNRKHQRDSSQEQDKPKRQRVVPRNRKIAGVLLHTAPELPTNGGGTPIFREVT
ncbi:Hypothetical protein PHPALM_3879 [Phytophthora palmivora]|uniref:Uncharacterized protein n=1 Tax=Phytophthora palmivora TaxID=4796 RepID=A0A2P4YL87_9STRA|nr:Hypothetical protein PHPALM_3879 [Phytophthora palmivora]